jgi:hypothetical protein
LLLIILCHITRQEGDKQDLRSVSDGTDQEATQSCAPESVKAGCFVEIWVLHVGKHNSCGLAAAKVISTNAGQRDVLAHREPKQILLAHETNLEASPKFMAGIASTIAWFGGQAEGLLSNGRGHVVRRVQQGAVFPHLPTAGRVRLGTTCCPKTCQVWPWGAVASCAAHHQHRCHRHDFEV